MNVSDIVMVKHCLDGMDNILEIIQKDKQDPHLVGCWISEWQWRLILIYLGEIGPCYLRRSVLLLNKQLIFINLVTRWISGKFRLLCLIRMMVLDMISDGMKYL